MFFKYLVVVAVMICSMEIQVNGAGPHHPKNSYVVKRETRKQEFNEHLNHHDKEYSI